jgi:hypothetical protein
MLVASTNPWAEEEFTEITDKVPAIRAPMSSCDFILRENEFCIIAHLLAVFIYSTREL